MAQASSKRRMRNYINRVEGELLGIRRLARIYSEDDAEVTPVVMNEVLSAATRALEALGWDMQS